MAESAETIPSAMVIDFMLRSRITLDDESYWDAQHYRIGIAEILGKAIANAIKEGREEDGLGKVLTGSETLTHAVPLVAPSGS